MAKMAALSWSLCFLCYFSLASIITIDAKNTFHVHETLKNGETLISSNSRFELGFFNVSSRSTESTRDSKYLGIWYAGIKPLTAVWVANRMQPLFGNRVELHINSDGSLWIRDDEGNDVCFVKLKQSISTPSLILLDSGNLVLKDGISDTGERYQWQSFDSPSDTLLPGMKLGWDFKLSTNRNLKSWNGDYVFGIKTASLAELVLEKNGVVQSRWGPWNGRRFNGSRIIRNNPLFRVAYHYGDDGVYFMFEMKDDSILLRLLLTSVGEVQFLKWGNETLSWAPVVTLTKDACHKYGPCGAYATCQADDKVCRCLEGFIVNSPRDWGAFDFSGGCRRRNALNCGDGSDGFVKYKVHKLPSNYEVVKGVSSERCGNYCLKECKCMAYTSSSVYGSHRDCLVWLDALVDIRASVVDGDELYIRMARAELGTSASF